MRRPRWSARQQASALTTLAVALLKPHDGFWSRLHEATQVGAMSGSSGPPAATQQPDLMPPRIQVLAMALACMLALAGIDLVFSVLAKEWTLRGSRLLLVCGPASSCLLFIAYALSLRVATMSVVTLGWVVLVSVGVVVLDQLRYGTQRHLDHWAVIGVLLAGVAYLVFIRPP